VFVGFRSTTSFNAQWCSPGGNLDLGETPEAAGVRELFEETNALVWADQLQLLRQTFPNFRNRIYRVDSFLLEATNEDLVNYSPDEHSTMIWRDIGQIMRDHRRLVLQNINSGTVPPRLAETFGIMEGLQKEPINSLAQAIRAHY
jgi:8-oxo-dGTP pyrophosphatase MutT (NUDIX family)